MVSVGGRPRCGLQLTAIQRYEVAETVDSSVVIFALSVTYGERSNRWLLSLLHGECHRTISALSNEKFGFNPLLYMSFLKSLFGGKSAETPEEQQQRTEERQFNTLRDSGVRAMKINELKLAVPYFEQALTLRPDDIQTISFMAEALVRMQEYANALPYLQRLAGENPENIEIALLLAQAQGQVGDYTAMQTTAAGLLSSEAADPRVPYMAAEAAHGLGDDLMAIAYLTQAIALRPDYHQALLFRARVLGQMGQWAETLQDTRVLIGTGGGDEEAFILHADALAAAGDAAGAEETYLKVLEYNPFCREAMLHLGAFYEQQEQWEKALAHYDGAISELPDFAEAYKRRGGVKHHLHDEAGAMDDLKKALELRPALGSELDGQFSSLENRVNEQFRSLNPYKF